MDCQKVPSHGKADALMGFVVIQPNRQLAQFALNYMGLGCLEGCANRGVQLWLSHPRITHDSQ